MRMFLFALFIVVSGCGPMTAVPDITVDEIDYPTPDDGLPEDLVPAPRNEDMRLVLHVSAEEEPPVIVYAFTGERKYGRFAKLSDAEYATKIAAWRKANPTKYSTWCPGCNKAHTAYQNGNERVQVQWSDGVPAQGPLEFPALRWQDSDARWRWAPAPPATLAALVQMVERTLATPTAAAGESLQFGEPWTEGRGSTTVEHLIREHGLTAEQLQPYADNPDYLNRIHGWKHTGIGTPAPELVSGRRREKRRAPTGVAGTFHGSAQIRAAITWIQNNVGEGVPISFNWDRTGVQTFPIAKTTDFSALALFGRSGHFYISAKQSTKLPITDVGFRYTLDGDDLAIDVDQIRLRGVVPLLFPQQNTVAGQEVGFDPMTLLYGFFGCSYGLVRLESVC